MQFAKPAETNFLMLCFGEQLFVRRLTVTWGTSNVVLTVQEMAAFMSNKVVRLPRPNHKTQLACKICSASNYGACN